MKRSIFLLAALAVSLPLFAMEADPRLDRAMRAALPFCADAKLSWHELPVKLLPRFTGVLAKIESASPTCAGQMAGIVSPSGGFYLGIPWSIADAEGQSTEEKLKNFAWANLQENVTVTLDKKLNEDGLIGVTLNTMTEYGSMPMNGAVDPEGRSFFFGNFRRMSGDIAAQRAALFDRFLATSPSKGPAAAPVTIVEFSDFQCPSCRRASGYADAVLATHGEKIRYVRFDMPLKGHPWAFPASLAGRAILRQKPDLFWEYKKAVYENQDNLNAFMFWDWARQWAQDHEIDLARYDADLNAAEVKGQILAGLGVAFSNDIRATPTYMVNGVIVEYGDGGKALAAYVDALLKKD